MRANLLRSVLFSLAIIVCVEILALLLVVRHQYALRAENSLSTLYVSANAAPAVEKLVPIAREDGFKVLTRPESAVLLVGPKGEELYGYELVSQRILDQDGPILKSYGGIWFASLIMLATVGLAVFRDAARFLMLAGPAVIAVASLALGTPCVSCVSVNTDWTSYLPFLSLGLAVLIAVCTWNRNVVSEGALMAVRLGCIATMGVQAYVLVLEPKFCVWCFSISIVCVSCLMSLGIFSEAVTTYTCPRLLKLGFTAFAMITGGLHVASAMGRYDPQTQKLETGFNPSRIGRIEDVTPGVHWDARSPRVLVVTLPWCGWCKIAKRKMTASGVAYKELMPCSYIQHSGCFDTRGQAVQTPLILQINSDEKIRYYHIGWPSGEAEKEILTQLHER